MMKKIPVSTAKRVAEEHGLKQCLLIGYDGEQVHVVTYGKTKADCEQAATAQDFWTGKIREFSFEKRTPITNDEILGIIRDDLKHIKYLDKFTASEQILSSLRKAGALCTKEA